MIVSVILCGLMSIVILFFVITNNGFSAVSIFYGLFLMFIYGGMTFSENKKKGSGTIYRRIFLTTYAVFFCIGFIANLFAERGSMAITNEALATCELPFCHIVIPQGLLSYLATQTVIFPARGFFTLSIFPLTSTSMVLRSKARSHSSIVQFLSTRFLQ